MKSVIGISFKIKNTVINHSCTKKEQRIRKKFKIITKNFNRLTNLACIKTVDLELRGVYEAKNICKIEKKFKRSKIYHKIYTYIKSGAQEPAEGENNERSN